MKLASKTTQYLVCYQSKIVCSLQRDLNKMAAKLSVAFEGKNKREIESFHLDYLRKIRSRESLYANELCKRVGKTVFRSYCAEIYIPETTTKKEKKFMALQ
jgi:predicted thioredoxin/glutaredoxin